MVRVTWCSPATIKAKSLSRTLTPADTTLESPLRQGFLEDTETDFGTELKFQIKAKDDQSCNALNTQPLLIEPVSLSQNNP